MAVITSYAHGCPSLIDLAPAVGRRLAVVRGGSGRQRGRRRVARSKPAHRAAQQMVPSSALKKERSGSRDVAAR